MPTERETDFVFDHRPAGRACHRSAVRLDLRRADFARNGQNVRFDRKCEIRPAAPEPPPAGRVVPKLAAPTVKGDQNGPPSLPYM